MMHYYSGNCSFILGSSFNIRCTEVLLTYTYKLTNFAFDTTTFPNVVNSHHGSVPNAFQNSRHYFIRVCLPRNKNETISVPL